VVLSESVRSNAAHSHGVNGATGPGNTGAIAHCERAFYAHNNTRMAYSNRLQ
jgi:hypothetical protein